MKAIGPAAATPTPVSTVAPTPPTIRTSRDLLPQALGDVLAQRQRVEPRATASTSSSADQQERPDLPMIVGVPPG